MTKDAELFEQLAALGQELVDTHLMRTTFSTKPDYPVAGGNQVKRIEYKEEEGRLYINDRQYFEGVSQDVWLYFVGGYQVAHKWLKDRKGRMLTFNELDHYRNIIAAIGETIMLQDEIDATVGNWPVE